MVRTKSFLLRFSRILVIAYVAVLAFLMIFENSIVYPAPKYPVGDWKTTAFEFEDANFSASDGTALHGWFVENAQPRATLLYFHGNGENVSHLADVLQRLNREYQLNVFAFDYRGYGRSAGKPNERGIRMDARAALEWLNTRTNTEPEDVIFFGKSIGGGVAVELASEKGCKALVLENTFSSMLDAASVHYPWIPVRWLMRNRYMSIEKIAKCPQPLLQSHGTDDGTIPFACGRRLFDASPSTDKQFVEIPNGDHNDETTPAFWNSFRQFLLRLGV